MLQAIRTSTSSWARTRASRAAPGDRPSTPARRSWSATALAPRPWRASRPAPGTVTSPRHRRARDGSPCGADQGHPRRQTAGASTRWPAAERRRRHQGRRKPVHRRVAGIMGLESRRRRGRARRRSGRDFAKSFGGARALDDVNCDRGGHDPRRDRRERCRQVDTRQDHLRRARPDRGHMLINGDRSGCWSPRDALARDRHDRAGSVVVPEHVRPGQRIPRRRATAGRGHQPPGVATSLARRRRRHFGFQAREGVNSLVNGLPSWLARQQAEILRAISRVGRSDRDGRAHGRPVRARRRAAARRSSGGSRPSGTTVRAGLALPARGGSNSPTQVTILRDGRLVRTAPAADETEETMLSSDARPVPGHDVPGPGGRSRRRRRSCWQPRGLSAPGRARRLARRSGPGRSSAWPAWSAPGRTELARALCRARAGPPRGRSTAAGQTRAAAPACRGPLDGAARRAGHDPRVAQGAGPACSAARSRRT